MITNIYNMITSISLRLSIHLRFQHTMDNLLVPSCDRLHHILTKYDSLSAYHGQPWTQMKDTTFGVITCHKTCVLTCSEYH